MEEIIQRCKDQGLRNTKALQQILTVLSETPLPISLAELETHEDLVNICDRTTIFRTLQRLESIGLLRRLNFAERGARFTLKIGAAHSEYLICQNCGKVEPIAMACPVHKLEDELALSSGFKALTHELTFYGTCPECAA